MEFKFPDSGRTVEIEGLSYLTLTLLRGFYEDTYPGKPAEMSPDPMETAENGNLNTDKFKEEYAAWQKEKETYDKKFAVWQLRMSAARWAAIKLYYASGVQNTDTEAVKEAVKHVSKQMPLRDAIRAGYEQLGVEFDDTLMDAYIYLFHVCITNASEQRLFEDMIMAGSAPTQEAVRETIFRFRAQI